MAQFDGLLAILEPHFKKKTTNFCELGVQGSIYIALWEVSSLVTWCEDNNLTLNTDKTKEIIVDMRKERRTHQPLFIRDLEVERVSSFKYLGVHISEDLTWTLNTTQLVFGRWGSLACHPRSSATSTAVLLREFWPAASLSGMEALQWGTANICREWWRLPIRSSELHCPLCRPFTIAEFTGELPPSFKDTHPPTTWTVHTPTLRTEVQECEMQDFQIKELLPLSH